MTRREAAIPVAIAPMEIGAGRMRFVRADIFSTTAVLMSWLIETFSLADSRVSASVRRSAGPERLQG